MFLVKFCFEDDDPILAMGEMGENLMKIAKRAGIPIWAPCAGSGSCGKCRVRILKGSLDSSPSFYIHDVEYEEGWRLACTSRICGDVEVLVG